MDDDIFSRSRLLLGDKAMTSLENVRVIVFGVGGVGGWAAETLVRTGLRHLTVVDFDTVAPSNINRQMAATVASIGCCKVDAGAARLRAINPDIDLCAINRVYDSSTADDFTFDDFDYVIDAIDSVADKALLINRATRSRCRLFSSMGAALKYDPACIRVTSFDRVTGDKLAAALRQRFKREGIYPAHKFKAVWSTEQPDRRGSIAPETVNPAMSAFPSARRINGSLMQVTASFGITLASLVINDIIVSSSAT